MISSLIWLVLIQLGKINADKIAWFIYLPVCMVEVMIYVALLPKFCDWLEERK